MTTRLRGADPLCRCAGTVAGHNDPLWFDPLLPDIVHGSAWCT